MRIPLPGISENDTNRSKRRPIVRYAPLSKETLRPWLTIQNLQEIINYLYSDAIMNFQSNVSVSWFQRNRQVNIFLYHLHPKFKVLIYIIINYTFIQLYIISRIIHGFFDHITFDVHTSDRKFISINCYLSQHNF